jgi:hypothetical protein
MNEQPAARTRTITWGDPLISAEAAKTMSGQEYLQAIIDGKLPAAPISHTLGYALVEAGEGRSVFECEPAEYHFIWLCLVAVRIPRLNCTSISCVH